MVCLLDWCFVVYSERKGRGGWWIRGFWFSGDFFVTFQGLILKVVAYEKDDGVFRGVDAGEMEGWVRGCRDDDADDGCFWAAGRVGTEESVGEG